MFSNIAIGIHQIPQATQLQNLPPQTPIKFPHCFPRSDGKPSSKQYQPLVALLQTIHRPADINFSHFQALGLHVVPDASPEDLIPDPSYLPPVEAWNSIETENLPGVNHGTKKFLNNGNLSPGVQTFRERQNELLIDNTAAFRSIRRIPSPAGETAVRLGNTYEFFKNLDFFTGYWDDTSLPFPAEPSEETSKISEVPDHLQTHQRTGIGSQLPPEYRQSLLTAFIKLVAYDFGCNVSLPRSEPRLYLTPPSPSPPSFFNSSATFIYRTPVDRSAARGGFVEGPLAAVSCRATTGFATEPESILDLAREVVAVLLTAQNRAREGKTEKLFGKDKWWATKPRWGGGPGGPIGREADKIDELAASAASSSIVPEKVVPETTIPENRITSESRRIFGINDANPAKRSRKLKDGNMQIYEIYRKMLPPSPTWDRKTRYSAIGKTTPGNGFDDIFLVSALNHHVSIVRVRVPEALLGVLDGGEGEWGKLVMWRSKWFDLFLKEERVQAMHLVWGMIAYLMRKVNVEAVSEGSGGNGVEGEKMDTNWVFRLEGREAG